jgi:poly(A) polymerase
MQINPLTFASPGIKRVIEVFEAAKPDSVRIVGGCVRDAIMNRPVNDIDFATPLLPEVVTDLFQRAGFHVEPTGIEHGTVTVIWESEPFEVTTLRRDVETDGRRAVVAFTEDWAEDAFRRDFTFNALYLAPDGTVYDYNGGIEDAQNRRIRFMGNANDRIREDYLRVLRMFRFQAVLGATVDPEAQAAAAANVAGIDTLSGERLEKEVIKLLCGNNRVQALRDMAASGVFAKVFGFVPDIEAIAARLERQATLTVPCPPLATVMAWDANAISTLMGRWKSGNDMRKHVAEPVIGGPVDLNTTPRAVRAEAYRVGGLTMRNRVLLSWVVDPVVDFDAVMPLVEAARTTVTFPVQGRDVVAMGVEPGKEVGQVLRRVEQRWVDADFPNTVPREWLVEEVARV